MLPTIQIGPLSLQVPGLVLILGLWIGLTLSESRAKRRGEDPSLLYNLVFISLIAGLAGARLSYAVAYPDAFTTSPWSLISINPGLLDPFAGTVIALAAGTIYIYRRQVNAWVTLDALTPLFAVMRIAIAISHLASGSAFGKPTGLPFAVSMWGELRHPSQVYKIVMALLIFIAIYFFDRTRWRSIPGVTFLGFAALTSFSRLLLEAFRGDSVLVGGGFRIAQVAAWVVLAICLATISWRLNNASDSQELGD